MYAPVLFLAAAALILGGGLQLVSLVTQTRREGRQWEGAANERARHAADLADRNHRAAEWKANRQPAWRGWRPLVVERIERESIDCTSYYLADPDGAILPAYRAGQYLMVRGGDSRGRTLARRYSISSAPRGAYYRITVKRIKGGAFSEGVLADCAVGQTFSCQAPRGDLGTGTDGEQPLILIAGGIGITPLWAIAEDSWREQPERPVVLFYQVRDLERAPLLEELAHWAAEHERGRLCVHISQPHEPVPDWVCGVGRLDGREVLARLDRLFGPDADRWIRGSEYRLCGPAAMVDGLSADLRSVGVAAEQIRSETFGGSLGEASGAVGEGGATAEARDSADSGVPAADSVSVLESVPVEVWQVDAGQAGLAGGLDQALRKTAGQVVGQFDCDPSRQTLLEAAEAAGQDWPSGCREGECGACVVRLLRGRVRNDHEASFEPLAADEALACIARPAGALRVSLS